MEFGAFFTKFYENNVGGCGATFDESNALDDLGFGKRDLELLSKELDVAVTGKTTVAELRKRVGSRKVGAATLEAVKREVVPAHASGLNISGCGARTEIAFVAFLRQWYAQRHLRVSEQEVQKLIHRDTLVSFFHRPELLAAIAQRWPSVGTLGPEKEGMTVAGLIGFLGSHSQEFREWDYRQGPRGG